jgi:hypothetical protein
MSILSFDNGSNAKLRDSVAQNIYKHEYAKIVTMDMQFIPHELADALMEARKDSNTISNDNISYFRMCRNRNMRIN